MDEKKVETLKKRALMKQLKSVAMTLGALGTFALISTSSYSAGNGSEPTTWLIIAVTGMICLPLPVLQLLLFSFNKGIRFHRLATYYVFEYAGALYSFIGLGALKFVGTIGRAEIYQEQVKYRDAQAVALKTLNENSSKANDPILKSVIRLNALLAADIECRLSRYERAFQIVDEYFTPLWKSYSLTKNQSLFTDLGTALNQFGCVLDHIGRFKDSLACYELSYSMRETTGDEQADVSLCNVGYANLRLGNFELAEKCLNDAMMIVKINGRINSDVGASIHCNLGETLLELDRLDEARKHLDLAIKHRQQRLPENSPDIAQVKGAYARLLSMEGNDSEAKKMFEECQTIYKLSTGVQNSDAAVLLRNYGTFSETRGDTEKARSLKKQSDEIFAQLNAIELPAGLAQCVAELTGNVPDNSAASESTGASIVPSHSSDPSQSSASSQSSDPSSSTSAAGNPSTSASSTNAAPKGNEADDGIVIDRSTGAIPGIHHSLETSYKLASSKNWFSFAAISYLFYLAVKDPTSSSGIILVMASCMIGLSIYLRSRKRTKLRQLSHILTTQNPVAGEAILCLETFGPAKNYVGIIRSGAVDTGRKTNVTFNAPTNPDTTSIFNNKSTPVRIFKDPSNDQIVAVATRLGIVTATHGFIASKGLKTRLVFAIGSLFLVPLVVSTVFLAALLTCSSPPPSVLPENLSAQEYYNLGKRYKGAGWIELSRQALDRAIKDGDADTKTKAEKYKNARLPRLPISKEAEKMNIQGYNSMFQNDQSEKTWRQCIQKYPNFEWPYSNLGSQLTEEGRLDEAEVLLKKALELNPTYGNALKHMAALKRKQGDAKAAEKFEERFRKAEPDDM